MIVNVFNNRGLLYCIKKLFVQRRDCEKIATKTCKYSYSYVANNFENEVSVHYIILK